MRNWFKKNEEKIMSILFKITGTLSFILAILYLCNMYYPSKFSVFIFMFVIGLMFISAKYTPNNKKVEK